MSETQLSLSAHAARNLATATVTVPQWDEITPRWLHKLLPWADVDGGVYRVNRVIKKDPTVNVLTVDSGEPKLPTTFVDYEVDPREYHLSTIQTVLNTHTRVTDLYSNRIDQLREQVRLTVDAVKEREEWELINHPQFGLFNEVADRISVSSPARARLLRTISMIFWRSSGRSPPFSSRIRRRLPHSDGRRRVAECRRQRLIIFGSPFITWRGIPLIPTNKLQVGEDGKTSILLLRVGEAQQGVVGLQKAGVTGEIEPGLVGSLHGHERKLDRISSGYALFFCGGFDRRCHRPPGRCLGEFLPRICLSNSLITAYR